MILNLHFINWEIVTMNLIWQNSLLRKNCKISKKLCLKNCNGWMKMHGLLKKMISRSISITFFRLTHQCITDLLSIMKDKRNTTKQSNIYRLLTKRPLNWIRHMNGWRIRSLNIWKRLMRLLNTFMISLKNSMNNNWTKILWFITTRCLN